MESSATKIISVSTREEAGNVVIEVADTGCGIDPEHIKYVFSRSSIHHPIWQFSA